MNNRDKSFCVLPWIHYATHPMGHVTLCCESDMTNHASSARDTIPSLTGDVTEIKNVDKHQVIEVFNSDYFKTVRKQMLNGEQPDACSRCYKKEQLGLDSKRLLEQREYPDFTIEDALDITDNDGSIADIKFQFVELRLGNICNVKCRTCNPASSNKIKRDYDQLQDGNWNGVESIPEYRGLENYNFRWCENDEFYADLISHCGELQSIYINGGEPTLIKQHWRFLQDLVDNGFSKHIKIWYSLNMTNIPDFAFGIWEHFREVEIRASIDDIEHRNEYIRNSTKWNSVLESMEKCYRNPSVNVTILQTISAYNLMYLPEFHRYWDNRYPDVRISHNFVSSPDFLSPFAIPDKQRLEIIERIMLSDNISSYQKHEIQSIYGEPNPDSNRLYSVFVGYTAELDRLRNETFAATFPELQQVLIDV